MNRPKPLYIDGDLVAWTTDKRTVWIKPQQEMDVIAGGRLEVWLRQFREWVLNGAPG